MMTGLGQKRKYRCFHVRSALPHKADIKCRDCNVRLVPKSDIDSITIRPLRWQGS